jgi:TatD DNase family protein
VAPPRWIDSHCHIQEPLQDRTGLDGLLGRAGQACVERVICIGTDLESSRAAVGLAQRVSGTRSGGLAGDGRGGAVGGLPLVYATVGLHPHDAVDGLEGVAALLEELAGGAAGARTGHRPGSLVGIGECGLDFYYEHSPREVQREVFAGQVRLANRLGLALVVHTRDAWDDTIAILRAEGPPASTIIHCFTGGPAEARRCLDLGAHLSFSGIVTFKNAAAVREAAQLCPADRLLVETDSPFLAPVPYRGKPNEPALVTVVGEAVAALRGVRPGELGVTTSANAERVFGLAPAGG